jgi:dihydroorotase
MHILLKKAKILHPSSPYNNRRLDILIQNGMITEIGKDLSSDGAIVVTSKNLHVSTGFVDIGTQICEPGFEFRETVESIRNAAFAGGYTTLATLPNTLPVIQNRSEVEFVINRGKALGIDIKPIGALSQDTEGKDLTQMMEMREAGAVGFSDGRKSIQNSGLLMRALLYVKSFDGVIIDQPNDASLIHEGQMHEGKMSTMLGMEGLPSIAEELMVARNLSILEYTHSRMHLRCISTRDSIQLIKDAQKRGLPVTTDVSAFHLMFQDTDLGTFDTHLKVFPPFRTKRDISALIKGIKDGTVQHVSALHEPLELERKKLEFPYADFGSIGLESAFAMAHTALKGKISLAHIVHTFTSGPRSILRIPEPEIDIGKTVSLSVFDPDKAWTFTKDSIRSYSKNSAAIGHRFIGKVIGAISKDAYLLNS